MNATPKLEFQWQLAAKISISSECESSLVKKEALRQMQFLTARFLQENESNLKIYFRPNHDASPPLRLFVFSWCVKHLKLPFKDAKYTKTLSLRRKKSILRKKVYFKISDPSDYALS